MQAKQEAKRRSYQNIRTFAFAGLADPGIGLKKHANLLQRWTSRIVKIWHLHDLECPFRFEPQLEAHSMELDILPRHRVVHLPTCIENNHVNVKWQQGRQTRRQYLSQTFVPIFDKRAGSHSSPTETGFDFDFDFFFAGPLPPDPVAALFVPLPLPLPLPFALPAADLVDLVDLFDLFDLFDVVDVVDVVGACSSSHLHFFQSAISSKKQGMHTRTPASFTQQSSSLLHNLPPHAPHFFLHPRAEFARQLMQSVSCSIWWINR